MFGKWDKRIALGLAVLLLIALGWVRLRQRNAVTVEITSPNGVLRQPLSQPRELVINEDGHHNVVVIRDGEVWMSEADCPDQLCVRQGKLRKGMSAAIVCLPNGVAVTLSGVQVTLSDEGDADAVSE